MRRILLFILSSCLFAVACNRAVEPGGQAVTIPVADQTDDLVVQASMDLPASEFLWPIDRAQNRITKKRYGTFVTPEDSPVSPEVFTGYHTGTDFEIFSDEVDAGVVITAICDGKIISQRSVRGYGGVVIQSCTLENNPITVLYGHLALSSFAKKSGDAIKAGDVIGTLGKGYSSETSGERKHLHLGIHQGTEIELRGYVPDKNQLDMWIDIEQVIN